MQLLGLLADFLLLRFDIIAGDPPFVVGPVPLFFPDELVDFLEIGLDPLLLFLQFLLAVFTQQQVKDGLQVANQVFLPFDRIPQLLVAQQGRELIHLGDDAFFLALADRPQQQIGTLGVGLPQ